MWRTLDRALLGVYFLIRASVLRCWVVALDIKASVNALVIRDLFFTGDTFFYDASNAPFPVICRNLWDMGPCLSTMHSAFC